MKGNKCIVIYESIYKGNTKKIADAISQTLGCKMVNASEASEIDLSEYEAIGFGSGIYFGSHHPAIMKIAEQMDSSEQSIFIFSSRGNPMHGRYHSSLKEVLVKKGKEIAGEFTVRGYDGTGPFLIFGGGNCGRPNEKDVAKAVNFIKKILPDYCIPDYYKEVKERLPVKDGIVNTYFLRKRNENIVLKGDIVTINQGLCVGCGRCISVCPVGVIEMQSHKAIPAKELDCTLCSLCSQNCKERAINIHYSWRDAINVANRHANRTSL